MYVLAALAEIMHLLGGKAHHLGEFRELAGQHGDILAALLTDRCSLRRQLLHLL
ncbi:hypothetical protein D3C73_1429210 [compost metagenome]